MKPAIFLKTAILLLIAIPVFTEEGDFSFSVKDSIENENFISTYRKQDRDDIYKKNELHNRIELKAGLENFYGFIISHQYANYSALNKNYQYNNSFKTSRNGRVSGKSWEININEAYLNAAFSVVRFRAGNQIYGWGTADVFNPTSYFNPLDLREFVFKDDDERSMGVPSVSAMWFIGEYTLETVFAPVNIPSDIQTGNDFWAIRDKKGTFPVIVHTPRALPVKWKNSAYGARFSGTFFGIDSSLSAYYGPDREPLMRPSKTLIEPNMPVTILVEPEYRMTAAAGFDMSLNLDPFVIQGEISYSHLRYGVVDQPYDANIDLPFKIERNRTVSYTAGANYFIPLKSLFPGHTGTAVFTLEWMQVLSSNSSVMAPLLSDIISSKFEDSFFDDRLKLSVSLMADVNNKGMTIFPKAGWDFQNGLSAEITYAYIGGNTGSLFGYFKNNDHVSVRCRYEF